MAYYNDGKVFRNLPEQVEKNKDDIETIQTAQKADESNINTNLNNINAHETRINALESIKMTQDGQNIKLTKSTGEIGNIAVGTVAGTNLLGGNDVTFKTINGEAITGDGDLAVDSGLSSLLWANLGIGRWANQTLAVNYDDSNVEFYDSFLPKYTNLTRYLYKAHIASALNNKEIETKITFNENFNNNININYMMYGSTFNEIELSSLTTASNSNSNSFSFACCPNLKKVSVKEGCTVKFNNVAWYTFLNDTNLVEIGAIDMSDAWLAATFKGCTKLKTLNCKNWASSFDISDSTAFEQSDLVNIISNLKTKSNNPVLTMGATNLNKLTTDQIAVATGKGWTLA